MGLDWSYSVTFTIGEGSWTLRCYNHHQCSTIRVVGPPTRIQSLRCQQQFTVRTPPGLMRACEWFGAQQYTVPSKIRY